MRIGVSIFDVHSAVRTYITEALKRVCKTERRTHRATPLSRSWEAWQYRVSLDDICECERCVNFGYKLIRTGRSAGSGRDDGATKAGEKTDNDCVSFAKSPDTQPPSGMSDPPAVAVAIPMFPEACSNETVEWLRSSAPSRDHLVQILLRDGYSGQNGGRYPPGTKPQLVEF